jgi:hypothetical protein
MIYSPKLHRKDFVFLFPLFAVAAAFGTPAQSGSAACRCVLAIFRYATWPIILSLRPLDGVEPIFVANSYRPL